MYMREQTGDKQEVIRTETLRCAKESLVSNGLRLSSIYLLSKLCGDFVVVFELKDVGLAITSFKSKS